MKFNVTLTLDVDKDANIWEADQTTFLEVIADLVSDALYVIDDVTLSDLDVTIDE